MVLDVWYLFPLRDVIRQLALDFGGIGPKAPMLDRVLGKHWRELYRVRQTRQADLFRSSSSNADPLQRDATWREVESWFRGRLQSIFSYCSEPLPLLTPKGRQIFSLFLTVSNPSKPAIDLAKHFASYVRR